MPLKRFYRYTLAPALAFDDAGCALPFLPPPPSDRSLPQAGGPHAGGLLGAARRAHLHARHGRARRVARAPARGAARPRQHPARRPRAGGPRARRRGGVRPRLPRRRGARARHAHERAAARRAAAAHRARRRARRGHAGRREPRVPAVQGAPGRVPAGDPRGARAGDLHDGERGERGVGQPARGRGRGRGHADKLRGADALPAPRARARDGGGGRARGDAGAGARGGRGARRHRVEVRVVAAAAARWRAQCVPRCRVSSIFKTKPEPSAEVAIRNDDQADINIFTVASGLLYEVGRVLVAVETVFVIVDVFDTSASCPS